MDILVNVANQKLKIATNLKSLVAGTQEFVRFVFNLNGDWDNLLTFAQFTQNGESFADADSIASYALEAVSALSGAKIINGVGEGNFGFINEEGQVKEIMKGYYEIINGNDDTSSLQAVIDKYFD